MAALELSSELLDRANIPARYWDPKVSLTNIPEAAPYRQSVLRYFKHFERMLDEGVGLYLWSTENGTGKTAIACIAAKWALANGISTFYYRSEELKDATVTNRSFNSTTTVLERAKEVDFLVLDDMGKEYKAASGFAESVIENLLRERIQRKRTTFVTANINPADLKTVFSQDVSEVMKEAILTLHVAGAKDGGKMWREERRREIKELLMAA